MSEGVAIRPLAEDGDTVLLRRADYEALLRHPEDAVDAAQVRGAEAASRPARTSMCRSSSPSA